MLKSQVKVGNGPPIDLGISEISRNGVVRVQFNQPLNVPEIFNVTAKGRSLLTFSELDVQRDLMDFSFVLRSDVEAEELVFYLELLDWQPTHLDILVNFTDPLLISKGLVKD